MKGVVSLVGRKFSDCVKKNPNNKKTNDFFRTCLLILTASNTKGLPNLCLLQTASFYKSVYIKYIYPI